MPPKLKPREQREQEPASRTSTSTSTTARLQDALSLSDSSDTEDTQVELDSVSPPSTAVTFSMTADGLSYEKSIPINILTDQLPENDISCQLDLNQVADKLRGINQISDISSIIDETVSHLMVDAFFATHPEYSNDYRRVFHEEITRNQRFIKEVIDNEAVLKKREELVSTTLAHAVTNNTVSMFEQRVSAAEAGRRLASTELSEVKSNLENMPLLKILLPIGMYEYLQTDHLISLTKSPLCPNAKTHFPVDVKHGAALLENRGLLFGHQAKTLNTQLAEGKFSEYLQIVQSQISSLTAPAEMKSWAQDIQALYRDLPTADAIPRTAFQHFQQHNLEARSTLAKKLLLQLLINDPAKIAVLLPYILSSMARKELNDYFNQYVSEPAIKQQIQPSLCLVEALYAIEYSITAIQAPACSSYTAPEQQTTWERAIATAEQAINKTSTLQEILGVTSIIRTATLLNPHKNPWLDGALRSDIHSSTRQALMKKAREKIVELANIVVEDMQKPQWMNQQNQPAILELIQRLKDLRETPVVKEFRNTRGFFGTPEQTTTVKRLTALLNTLEQSYKTIDPSYTTEQEGRPSAWSSWFGGK